MAETRTVVEYHVYVLNLNPMDGRYEDTHSVACSFDQDALLNWMESQRADEPYYDTVGLHKWYKVFMKDTPLEWYNDLDGSSGTIASVWVTEERMRQLEHLRWIGSEVPDFVQA